jgi:hypothetical protein
VKEKESILRINNIEVKYHEVILVLKGVSISSPSWVPMVRGKVPLSRPSLAC